MKNNLSAFLAGSDDPRDYLASPLILNGGVAYTNGHMAVFVIDPASVASGKNAGVEKVLQDHMDYVIKHQGDWFDCPSVDISLFTCKKCDGTGKVEKCKECDGHGTVEVSSSYNDYEVDCKSCDAGENKECEHCTDGVSHSANASVKGMCVNPSYILKTSNNMIQPKLSVSGKPGMIMVKFDGGFGVLMTTTGGSGSQIELCVQN